MESDSNPVYGLFSPDGDCQHQLGYISLNQVYTYFTGMTMMLLGKQIIACGLHNSVNCYLYDIDFDTWTGYPGSSWIHTTHGVVNRGKMYLPDEQNPEVLNPVTNNWSSWVTASSATQLSCYVSWKDFIFKFGGVLFEKYVSRYNPTTNVWSLETTSAPFEIYNSGCVALPNDNILIVGSGYNSAFYRAYVEYNVAKKSWSNVMYGKVDHFATVPILLGSRVFVIPSSNSKVIEEYHYSNQTITTSVQNFNMIVGGYSSSLAVPAKWFAHLPGGCSGIL